jgi:hypothetical protein
MATHFVRRNGAKTHSGAKIADSRLWQLVVYPAVFTAAYLWVIWRLIPFESWPDITRYIARFGGLDPAAPVDTSSLTGWLTSEAGWAWWINAWLDHVYTIDEVLH